MKSSQDLTAKLALQTISWGDSFPVQQEIFDYIASLGFKGIEFAQTPAVLGDPQRLEALLGQSGLRLIGLAGGSLASRLTFARQLKSKIEYFYVTSLTDEAETILKAVKDGFTIGLHPFLFTPISSIKRALTQRSEFIKEHNLPDSAITILPDTGHAYLAQEDISDLFENQSIPIPIRAIHLKDWQPGHGASFFTYSRGFCEIDNGVVAPLKLLDSRRHLVSGQRSIWLVIEQDFASDPFESAACSIRRLRTHFNLRAEQQPKARPNLRDHHVSPSKPELAEFVTAAMKAANRGTQAFYHTIAQEWSKLLKCPLITLWELQNHSHRAILRQIYQSPGSEVWRPKMTILSTDIAFSGLAIAEQRVRAFNLSDIILGRKFEDETLIEHFNATRMLSIPIFNRWNAAQPLLLVNAFGNNHLFDPNTNDSDPSEWSRIDGNVELFRTYTAIATEHCWNDHRSQAANLATWYAGAAKSSPQLLLDIAGVIQRMIRSRKVFIYLSSPTEQGETLELKIPPPSPEESLSNLSIPEEDRQTQERARNLAERAFKERSILNTLGGEDEGVPMVAVPVYSQQLPIGIPTGVICCVGKNAEDLNQPNSRSFSTVDEVTLDAIQAATTPHLARLKGSEALSITVSIVAHQMKYPISLIIGVADMMNNMRNRGGALVENLEKTYNPDTVIRHANFLTMVANRGASLNPDYVITLNKRRILLFDQVIRPAIDYVGPLLIKARLPRDCIHADSIQNLPPLIVDESRFQEVVYNLLSNAIKYRSEDKPASIRIYAKPPTAKGTWLVFEDNGIGVPAGMNRKIFEQGMRGSNAIVRQIEGEGLGLWIVRKILRQHGADIQLLADGKQGNSTQFGIFLPRELESF